MRSRERSAGKLSGGDAIGGGRRSIVRQLKHCLLRAIDRQAQGFPRNSGAARPGEPGADPYPVIQTFMFFMDQPSSAGAGEYRNSAFK